MLKNRKIELLGYLKYYVDFIDCLTNYVLLLDNVENDILDNNFDLAKSHTNELEESINNLEYRYMSNDYLLKAFLRFTIEDLKREIGKKDKQNSLFNIKLLNANFKFIMLNIQKTCKEKLKGNEET